MKGQESFNSIEKKEDSNVKELSKYERLELRGVLAKYVDLNDDPSLE